MAQAALPRCGMRDSFVGIQASAPGAQLLLRTVGREAVHFLHPAGDLIAPARGDQVFVADECGPPLLDLAGELSPRALDTMTVHFFISHQAASATHSWPRSIGTGR